jgi:hypothetical protein
VIRWVRPEPTGERGQALVELAIILPLLLLIVLGTLEFGLAFDHNLTLSYATREGARTGAALAAGNSQIACAVVDDYIIAAVERVLTSEGSPVNLNRVSQVTIYKATSSGQVTAGTQNVWVYAPGQGPIIAGQALDFKKDPTKQPWSACSRNNGTNADYLGVSLAYTYDLQTALGALVRIVNLPMLDHTVMRLNPTDI